MPCDRLKRLVLRATLLLAAVGSPAADLDLAVREPQPQVYRISVPDRVGLPAGTGRDWVLARREGSGDAVVLGQRVVVQFQPGTSPDKVLPDDLSRRQVGEDLWLVETPDVAGAFALTQHLVDRAEVLAVHPDRRRLHLRQRAYAARPNDPLYSIQWHLDNRDPVTGVPRGIDLNVRPAWPLTRGAGVTVAVADGGVTTDHPDLGNTAGAPHYDFFGDRPGEPMSDGYPDHGTACAGLIGAMGGNDLGVVGLAPEARLASWAIFGLFDFGNGPEDVIAEDSALAAMFQHDKDTVAVQNHSWGSYSLSQSAIDVLSEAAIETAVTKGRSGRGVVMVRAAGNEREDLVNSIDDGFAADPRVIAVAAVRADGRATTYSSPGANILVGAPSGDSPSDFEEDPAAPNIVTTDMAGSDGYNTAGGTDGDYAQGVSGFNGTSASCPQIAGICALILAANPQLGYRDVQQILVQSSRHYDFADSDVRTNGAGFVVSHNVGFGVPDAGLAVQLARHWSNRPALKIVKSSVNTTSRPVVDDSLRLELQGTGLPGSLTSIHCLPAQGPQVEAATARLPMVYVGLGNTNIDLDLHGRAALIQRGDNFFSEKIDLAARAGAEFVVIYNNVATDPQLLVMFGTGFAPIPAIFIDKANGDALRNYVETHPANTARLNLTPTTTKWTINDSIVCEQVGVRLNTTHPYRSDLRITLVSPSGTRSILQFINGDYSPGPQNWTYWTAHNFYESSAGEWRLDVTDERPLDSGSITSAQLILRGTAITDEDKDGLDDDWERQNFGDLRYGPKDDPDGDGLSNAREQCLNTQANRYDPIVPMEFLPVANGLTRITLPAGLGRYVLDSANQVEGPYTALGMITNGAPYLEVFAPTVPAGGLQQFIRTRAQP